MKPCEYYIELLSAALDGMLSEEQELELAEHLASCPACRELGPQLVAAHAAFTRMEELEAPEGFAEAVMARVRAEESARPKVVPFHRRPAVKVLGALAACAVLCVGLLRGGLPEIGMDSSGAAAPSASAPAASAPAAWETEDLESAVKYYNAAVDAAPTESAAEAAQEVSADVTAEHGETKGLWYAYGNPSVLPVTCTEHDNGVPEALVLGSVDSLAQFLARFPDDDLSVVADTYGADYFNHGRLLAVVVEASSGANTYELGEVFQNRVTVVEHAPKAGTCDMARWLLLAEVDTIFDDGDVLGVDVIR